MLRWSIDWLIDWWTIFFSFRVLVFIFSDWKNYSERMNREMKIKDRIFLRKIMIDSTASPLHRPVSKWPDPSSSPPIPVPSRRNTGADPSSSAASRNRDQRSNPANRSQTFAPIPSARNSLPPGRPSSRASSGWSRAPGSSPGAECAAVSARRMRRTFSCPAWPGDSWDRSRPVWWCPRSAPPRQSRSPSSTAPPSSLWPWNWPIPAKKTQ